MKQQTLAGSGFDKHRKQTRREQFLQQMDALVPWSCLAALVEPYYPTGERGRPPVGLERMLRLYCLAHWYNLSDPGLEEALYDLDAMRRFVGIDLGREPAPHETTICKFRHLLEAHELGAAIFAEINAHLADQGIQVSGGTMVDATIIDAPSSTKNERRERDHEMHQTRKGNRWYFGMKGHFGVDSRTKLIHSVVVAAANTADGTVLGQLLHGGETRVWGDKAYDDQGLTIAGAAPAAQDHTHDKGHRHRPLTPMQKLANHYKSTIRAKVEPDRHDQAGLRLHQGALQGPGQDANRLYVAAALANLFRVRRRLSPA